MNSDGFKFYALPQAACYSHVIHDDVGLLLEDHFFMYFVFI